MTADTGHYFIIDEENTLLLPKDVIDPLVAAGLIAPVANPHEEHGTDYRITELGEAAFGDAMGMVEALCGEPH